MVTASSFASPLPRVTVGRKLCSTPSLAATTGAIRIPHSFATARTRSTTIYKLTPPAGGGAWTKTVLYSFTGGFDGSYPTASPVLDSSGALYGTTSDGGTFNRAGTVYKLTPPAGGSGSWEVTTLYPFQDEADGGYPQASLIFDGSGNLYGTTLTGTSGAGVVFELTPPSGGSTWSETVLHTFAGGSDGASPYTPVLLVGTTLYGATWGGGSKGAGTVFEITP